MKNVFRKRKSYLQKIFFMRGHSGYSIEEEVYYRK